MENVEPKVFLIGETRCVQPGLQQFLEHYGAADWTTDARSDSELLIECMGRMCYRSFNPDLNPNLSRVRQGNQTYLQNILKSGHGSVLEHATLNFVFCDVSRVFCYAPEAELLTREGWKPVANISTTDVLLTLDPETQKARWSHVLSTHEFDYEGRVYAWSNSQNSCPRVTEDHLMWAASYDLRRARGLSNEENVAQWATKVPAKELWGRRFAIDCGIRVANTDDGDVTVVGGETYDGYNFMSWLGWMATSGNFSKDRPKQCTIVQSKLGNLPVIRELMNELFGDKWREHGPYGESELYQFTISDGALADFTRHLLGPNKLFRDLDLTFFLTKSPRLLRAFYEAALAGDGSVHHKSGHEVLYCLSEKAAGQWQAIVAAMGMCANIRVDDRVGESHLVNGIPITASKPCYIVSVSRTSAMLIEKPMQRVESYSGKVYCPKTADGLVFVRNSDHGVPFWCGNTHELVRHRAGTAMSQESLRFVRLDHIKQWLPVCFTEDMDAMAIAIDVVEKCEEAQTALAELWNLDSLKFSDKKKLTSAMRRLAPMGLATNIGWSANIRAVRHVLEMRTSPHSEVEIRKVFAQVGELCIARYPNLFQDYVKTLVDGIPHFHTEHAKV